MARNAGAPRRGWWRVIPAALTLMLGLSSSAVGVFSVLVITYRASRGLLDYINLLDVCAGCSLYLGPGAAWSISSVLFWKGRARLASFATLVGILIPIILFALMALMGF
jgi:hypothetical protein